MIEVIINKQQENQVICLVENGKLIEVYNENKKSKKARNEGNIYLGIVKDIIPGMQAAFIDIGTEKNSFIHVKDVVPQKKKKKKKKNKNKKIKNIKKKKKKLVVQVQKDSNDKKGARTTTHIKLTGKYIILMPNTNIITISQKITEQKEKDRLLDIVKKNLPENMGAIVRTAAEKEKSDELVKDLKRLKDKWNKIKEQFNKSKEKQKLLYENSKIIKKMLLDLTKNKIEKIIINDKKEYEEINKKLETLQEKNIKLELDKNNNLFKRYEIEKQIEKSQQRKIWLNCGGFITIDLTEALVAIDVNSGKFTGKSTLEDTVYKVNYEATIEIAKQLRLRDIGGIIIIDYIDMKKQENKDKIEKLLKDVLKNDRAKTQVEGFTKLNLMEMTRKHICSHNS